MKLDRTRQLMNLAVPDAVIEGYEHLIDGLALPDPDDRHVLAAAIHAKADTIITLNVRDFPFDIVSRYDIEVCRPDTFVSGLLNDNPADALVELKKQRARFANPPKSVEQFLESLEKVGLSSTVNALRKHAELL